MSAARKPCLALALSLALAAALCGGSSAGAPLGEILLPVYAIVDDSVQLGSGKADVSTYEDVEYSKNVRDCLVPVEERADAWLAAHKLVPTSRRSKGSQYRIEIELQSPKAGTLVVDYAWLPSKRVASLDLRFLSSERLTQEERESLVFGLDLVTLRAELAASMKCQ